MQNFEEVKHGRHIGLLTKFQKHCGLVAMFLSQLLHLQECCFLVQGFLSQGSFLKTFLVYGVRLNLQMDTDSTLYEILKD